MKKYNISAAIGAIAVLAALGCSSTPNTPSNPCHKIHGAVDIGSGSTKLLAAVVDVCQNPARIVKKEVEERFKISFIDAIEKSETPGEGKIPSLVLTEASAKIATSLEKVPSLDRLKMVATAAFRQAKNGPEAAAEISKILKERLEKRWRLPRESFDVQILTPLDEARAGARSARLGATASSEPTVVWDIGGGSMQIYSDDFGLVAVPMGSVGFKNLVIEKVKKQNSMSVTSANPLNDKPKSQNAEKAVRLAQDQAQQSLNDKLKHAGKTARWLGIGGVLALSVQKQIERELPGAPTKHHLETKKIDVDALAKTLSARSERKDEEIESDFKETEITNLALVLGYMKTIGIKSVETVEASLVEGLVTE